MKSPIKQMVFAAMCIAIGVVLPQFLHFIPNAGQVVLPMHIPVLVSGFICGPFYGLLTGILTPILSHFIFGMPPAMMLPAMVFELAVYGLLTGLLYDYVGIKNEMVKNYVVLILAMLIGRVVYGLANAFIFKAGAYSVSVWVAAVFVTALPGIIIQLIIIPALVMALKKLLR
ncbi:MAG: ECF transporter S component [Erysipelotrichaceae bacterium]|nr:ECF transporter S component [Erysipelotrichaceae bacterium]